VSGVGGSGIPGFPQLPGRIAVFLLPYSDDLYEENIMMHEKNCPVLSDPEPEFLQVARNLARDAGS
jgi:hypothetical protein